MTDAQRAVAAEIASGPRGGVRGPFLALLHNPELARRLQEVGEYLRFQTGLPDRLVELVILVTARHYACQFEWYAHERLARKAGLPDPVIAAIAAGLPTLYLGWRSYPQIISPESAAGNLRRVLGGIRPG